MKERPILFSAPMVRAILEGRKTQTRRVVKPPLLKTLSCIVDCGNGWWGDEEGEVMFLCPYGQPGDRLWVREICGIHPKSPKALEHVAYKADGDVIGCGRWTPSIHMPRWASRILLEIVSVRVELLQDYGYKDAVAEGVISLNGSDRFWKDYLKSDKGTNDFTAGSAMYSFQTLWQSINGMESWDADPWVWVIEFKRVTP